jgi:hypothetical protein
MKFSELLGEPERDQEVAPTDAEPISVFAPAPSPAPPAEVEHPQDPPASVAAAPVAPPVPAAPVAPPVPTAPRTGLAEVNVRQVEAEMPTAESETAQQLAGLDTIVDDLLPSAGRRGRR